MFLKRVFFSLVFLLPLSLHAASNKDQDAAFLRELETAKYCMSLRYGPMDWKQTHLNWDADIAFEQAKTTLFQTKPSTIRDYQKIFRNFLGTTQDYHVSASFYTTETALIPIGVKSANGRYFISKIEFDERGIIYPWFFGYDEIDEEALISELIKCEVGDEILAVNGIAINDVIELLIDEELYGNRTPTGYALAERMLFTRLGTRGHTIPTGSATIKVLPKESRRAITITLPWVHSKEWVKDVQPKKLFPETKKWKYRIEEKMRKDFSVEIARLLLNKSNTKELKLAAAAQEEEQDIDLRSKSFLPDLGRVIWETPNDSFIHAYIYVNPQGKKIGYLYIPHFMETEEYAEWMIDNYIEILKHFNQHTEALVLDINDNPGGNYFYMLAVLSLLTDTPLALPTQIETLLHEEAFGFAQLYNDLRIQQSEEFETSSEDEEEDDTLSGYVINDDDVERMMNHALAIVDLWESGAKKTPEMSMFGFTQAMPHPKVKYTKPIVLLINELDFSCGDLFPAILQDNHRAVLFGKKTAGAGGYVRPFDHTGQFGVMGFNLTGSLCRRTNGSVIENLGITPDVPYEVTARDLKDGYVDYIHAVNQEVQASIKKK